MRLLTLRTAANTDILADAALDIEAQVNQRPDGEFELQLAQPGARIGMPGTLIVAEVAMSREELRALVTEAVYEMGADDLCPECGLPLSGPSTFDDCNNNHAPEMRTT